MGLVVLLNVAESCPDGVGLGRLHEAYGNQTGQVRDRLGTVCGTGDCRFRPAIGTMTTGRTRMLFRRGCRPGACTHPHRVQNMVQLHELMVFLVLTKMLDKAV